MKYEKIIHHLVEISEGKCSITETDILAIPNEQEQQVLMGLLTLHEEAKYNRERLEKSNKEKDFLLKELHHRVKNNLQIISSILSLESYNIQYTQAKSVLDNCKRRVQTIGDLHQKLYQSEETGAVAIEPYLEQVSDLFKGCSNHPDKELKIHLTSKTPNTPLPLQRVVPLGLAINEILTNAFKHSKETKVDVFIELNSTQKELEITIYDSSETEFKLNNEGIGLDLLESLIDQADAKLSSVYNDQNKGRGYHIWLELEDIPLLHS